MVIELSGGSALLPEIILVISESNERVAKMSPFYTISLTV